MQARPGRPEHALEDSDSAAHARNCDCWSLVDKPFLCGSAAFHPLQAPRAQHNSRPERALDSEDSAAHRGVSHDSDACPRQQRLAKLRRRGAFLGPVLRQVQVDLDSEENNDGKTRRGDRATLYCDWLDAWWGIKPFATEARWKFRSSTGNP